MTSWDLLRYMYFTSCIAMAYYIVSRSDQFLISYGMSELERERKKEEPGFSFVGTMIFYVIISPILWIIIIADKNKRGK